MDLKRPHIDLEEVSYIWTYTGLDLIMSHLNLKKSFMGPDKVSYGPKSPLPRGPDIYLKLASY